MRVRIAAVVVVLLGAGLLTASPANAAATLSGSCSGNASGDFNGDAAADLAAGSPREDVGSAAQAGAVTVVYGEDGSGLDEATADTITQNSGDVVGGAEANDEFGGCVAAGDFDGDGFDDLAVGVPGEDVGSVSQAGAVQVLYGGDDGIDTDGFNQLIHQDTSGVAGGGETNDEWGAALAVGNFNDDEREDLVVGAPLEDIGSRSSAGSLWVLFGAASGVTTNKSQLWHQDISGVAGGAESNDRFAQSLTTGDLDGDSLGDLVVGVPGEDLSAGKADAGVVQVFYGTDNGLNAARDRVFSQDTSGVINSAQADDRFGLAVSTGDFDGDGNDDLAIGVPSEDDNATDEIDIGAVNVLYGSASGLTAAGDQFLTQDVLEGGGATETVNADDDEAEEGDAFGASLTTGDFDGDDISDLAVGAPFEDFNAEDDEGAVDVIFGTEGGSLDASTTEHSGQDDYETSDGGEIDDFLGISLTAGDYDSDQSADLSIGVPFEDVGTEDDAGAVHVLYAGYFENDQTMTQDDLDETSEDGDLFGFSIG